jgi:ADP-ribose pyrophosphatase YjhB (NUDIX family)
MAQIIPTWHEVILWEWQIIELISFEVAIGEKRKMFERARRPPGVRVIMTRDDRILLSCEYRREQGKYDYRLPGGKVIDTIAEMRAFDGDIITEATDAAMREAREEAGVVIRHPELIHTSHCGANIEWDLYYFLATDFDETGEHDRDDEGESDLTTAWYTFDEVRSKILAGEMSEDRSVAVILKWMMQK